jgi:hypothetical protein
MQMIAFSYPTVAVSTIYCIWPAYRRALLQRERALRERVAYMLWVLANPMSAGHTKRLRFHLPGTFGDLHFGA